MVHFLLHFSYVFVKDGILSTDTDFIYLLEKVHFQHTAKFISRLISERANYTLQVRVTVQIYFWDIKFTTGGEATFSLAEVIHVHNTISALGVLKYFDFCN